MNVLSSASGGFDLMDRKSFIKSVDNYFLKNGVDQYKEFVHNYMPGGFWRYPDTGFWGYPRPRTGFWGYMPSTEFWGIFLDPQPLIGRVSLIPSPYIVEPGQLVFELHNYTFNKDKYVRRKVNYSYPVYDLFESVRLNIVDAMKRQQTFLEIPLVGTEDFQVLPKPNDNKYEYHRLYQVYMPISNYDVCRDSIQRGLSPRMIHQLVIPMLKNYFTECGVQLEDFRESIVLEWTQGTCPNYPFPTPPKIVKKPATWDTKLINAFNTQQLTDVRFICAENKTIEAHAIVLSVSNEHFQTLFSTKFKESKYREIDLSGFTIVTVKAAIEYIYTGCDPFEKANHGIDPIEMLILAHSWGMEELSALAANIIGTNVSEGLWRDVGLLGATYESTYLLQVYNCYRIRHGEEADPIVLPVMKKLGVTTGLNVL